MFLSYTRGESATAQLFAEGWARGLLSMGGRRAEIGRVLRRGDQGGAALTAASGEIERATDQ